MLPQFCYLIFVSCENVAVDIGKFNEHTKKKQHTATPKTCCLRSLKMLFCQLCVEWFGVGLQIICHMAFHHHQSMCKHGQRWTSRKIWFKLPNYFFLLTDWWLRIRFAMVLLESSFEPNVLGQVKRVWSGMFTWLANIVPCPCQCWHGALSAPGSAKRHPGFRFLVKKNSAFHIDKSVIRSKNCAERINHIAFSIFFLWGLGSGCRRLGCRRSRMNHGGKCVSQSATCISNVECPL